MANILNPAGGGQTLKDKSDEKFTFFESCYFSAINFHFDKTKQAFSVAEAMITLLIVSVVLAAMAPMMTKKAQNNGGGSSKWMFTRNGSDITRPGGNVGIGVPQAQNPDAKFEIRGSNGIVLKITAPGSQNSNILEINKGDKQIVVMTAEGLIYMTEPIVMRNPANKVYNPLTTYEGEDWRNALMRDGGLMVNTIENRRVLSINMNGAEKAWVNSDGSSSFAGVPKGTIVIWSGGFNNIPSGWALCNGQNGTPDLRNRFVVGAGYSYSPGNTGGADWVTLTVDQMPSHNHGVMEYAGRGSESRNHISALTNDWSSGQTTYAGGNQAHENRPPYYALAYIMKL